jgi:hypothetical protein
MRLESTQSDGIFSEETTKAIAPKEFSQLAELHVAGLVAEAGWRIYFPHRDDGFDFIAVRSVENETLIRPVQVKGKYPVHEKLDKKRYGYIGKLTQTNPEMVLAIPYFEVGSIPTVRHVAFMPFTMLRPHSRGWRCEPAKLASGLAVPRREYAKYFDDTGVKRLKSKDWSAEILAADDE